MAEARGSAFFVTFGDGMYSCSTQGQWKEVL